jgi:hypothetical protein
MRVCIDMSASWADRARLSMQRCCLAAWLAAWLIRLQSMRGCIADEFARFRTGNFGGLVWGRAASQPASRSASQPGGPTESGRGVAVRGSGPTLMMVKVIMMMDSEIQTNASLEHVRDALGAHAHARQHADLVGLRRRHGGVAHAVVQVVAGCVAGASCSVAVCVVFTDD